MNGSIRCVVIAGLLAGCGDDTSMTVMDAPGGGGMVIAWSSAPAEWPGDLGDSVTIERATFAVDSLRVVGDAAPGDPRTTARDFMLRWDDASRPEDIGFPDAPTGVYSQLSIVIDGHVAGPSVELRGRARVSGTDFEYRITDDSPVSVTLPIDALLMPPAVTTLGLHIDFDLALEGVDFASLDIDNGRLELDNTDPEIAAFRVKLIESMQIVD